MLGAIIGAGASLAGSLLGNNSAKKQAAQNAAAQKEFAQKGVQWKVADAKKAGVHPLAALGAQTHSFTNVSGGSDYSGLASAGQDLGRAIDATRDKSERVDAYTSETRKLALQRMGLENTLLASQIAKIRQPGHPPASPNPANPLLIPGQGDSPGIKNEPMERQGWNDSRPHAEAGAVAELGYTKTPTGYAPVMSKDAKDRLEEDPFGVIGWNVRNRLGPMFQVNKNPPEPALSDEYWAYHPGAQEYRLFRRKRSGTHSRFRYRSN